MRFGRQVLGLPVVDLNKGEEIGEVVDVIFNPELVELSGVIIESKQERYFIPYQGIYSLGEDAVTIEKKEVITNFEFGQESLVDQERGEIMDSKVITSTGEDLGMVKDIVWDDEGRLIGYQLTDGLVQDILEGREILVLDDNITYGKDAIIVQMMK